jgi:hypothetical protein
VYDIVLSGDVKFPSLAVAVIVTGHQLYDNVAFTLVHVVWSSVAFVDDQVYVIVSPSSSVAFAVNVIISVAQSAISHVSAHDIVNVCGTVLLITQIFNS